MSLLAPGVAVFFMVDPGDLPPLGAGVAGLPGSLIFGSVGEPEMAEIMPLSPCIRRSLRLDVVGFSGVNIQRAYSPLPSRVVVSSALVGPIDRSGQRAVSIESFLSYTLTPSHSTPRLSGRARHARIRQTRICSRLLQEGLEILHLLPASRVERHALVHLLRSNVQHPPPPGAAHPASLLGDEAHRGALVQ